MFALISLVSHFFFIFLTFWALQGIRIDKWLKKHHISQGRILYLFVAITIGFTVSQFFIELVVQSQNLLYLF